MRDMEIKAVLSEFSRSNNNSEWECSNSEFIIIPPKKCFLYPNGNCKENEGYVSIIFGPMFRQEKYQIWRNTEIRYYVSVEDVAGNKRFSQSIIFAYDMINHHDLEESFSFGLEKYHKRETLLNDPDELLPGDCLNVCIHMDYIFMLTDADMISEIDVPFIIDEEGKLCINLDSHFGEELCRESGVYGSAFELTDSRIMEVRISPEERPLFEQLFHIICRREQLEVTSINDFSRLYRLADKYDIQSVIETCRQLIKAFLCKTNDPSVREHSDKSLPDILELADELRDNDLKNAVLTYQESKEKFGANYNALGEHLKEKLYTDWKCEYKTLHTFIMSILMKKPKYEFYQ